MKPLPPPEGTISQVHTSGIFLEKPGLLKEALKRSELWDSQVPGAKSEVRNRERKLEDSLLKLKAEQQAGMEGASAVISDPNDDGNLILTNVANGATTTGDEDEGFDSREEFKSATEAKVTANIQKAGLVKQGESDDPVVVFIRHGRTPHNNLGLFTGWEVCKLSLPS